MTTAYVCVNCGDANDTAKDGGMVMGGSSFCLKEECIAAAMKPINDIMRGVVFE